MGCFYTCRELRRTVLVPAALLAATPHRRKSAIPARRGQLHKACYVLATELPATEPPNFFRNGPKCAVKCLTPSITLYFNRYTCPSSLWPSHVGDEVELV